MARMRLHAAKVLTLAGLLVAGVGASSALATAGTPAAGNPPPTVPGSPGDDCSHGNSGKECRPDPNANGKDCEDHGNARGNEDHCAQATTTTTESTTTSASTTTGSSTTSTSSSTTTATTTTSGNPTPSSGGSTTTTSVPESNNGSGATPTPPTKPELQDELAGQVKGVRGAHAKAARVNPHELPFTGFPAWALALIGSAMLLTGLGLRKAVS